MKKLLDYPPLHFLFFLIAGIFFQFHFCFLKLNPRDSLLVLGFLLVLLYSFRNTFLFNGIVYGFFSYLGAATIIINNDRNFDTYFQHHVTHENVKALQVSKVLKTNTYYRKYEAEVIQIDDMATKGRVLVNIINDSLVDDLKVGQLLLTKTEFSSISPPFNPYQFDYKNFLNKQGIYQQIYLEGNNFRAITKNKFSFLTWADEVRTSIQSSLRLSGFSGDELAVMEALFLGKRQDISVELSEDYSRAGVIHILAVSGLHIGILLGIIHLLLKPLNRLRNGKIFRVILSVLFLWFFALVAGLSASVIRSVTMFSLVALGLLINRQNAVEYSVILSMFLLLIVRPIFLFEVGFQLSYAAVFGIIWLKPLMDELWKPRYKLIDFYWQLTKVSIAAQLGVLPLSLFYFNQFPALFIFSNLIIVPFLGGILFCGILVIILSLLNSLPSVLQLSFDFVINTLNKTVAFMSAQESWLLTDITFSLEMLIASNILIVFGCQWVIKKNAQRLMNLMLVLLLLQSVFWFDKYKTESKTEFIVFHKSRYSLLGERQGTRLNLYKDANINNSAEKSATHPYVLHEGVRVSFIDSLPRYFRFKSMDILVIDNNNYPRSQLNNPMVILINSPKINLDRLIKEIQPTGIIADGSNYKSYVRSWQESSRKTKTPFWYTGQKGAYIVR